MDNDEMIQPEYGETNESSGIIKKKKKIQPNLKGRTVEEVLGLANRLLRTDLSKYSIDALPIEHGLVDNIIDMSTTLRDKIGQGDDIVKTYGELSKDMFLSLYKPYPEMLDGQDMHNNYKLNHSIMDELTNDAQFNILRDYCQLDEFAAGIGSLSLHDNAIERLYQIKDELQGEENIIDAINEAIASDQDLQDILNNVKSLDELQQAIQNAGGDPSALAGMQQRLMMKLADAMKLANEANNQYKKVVDENPDQLRKVQDAITSGIKDAISNVSEASDLVQQWGFSTGEDIRVPFDSKLRAINQIRKSKKLKKFTDLIGALKDVARREQKSKSRLGASEIVNVKIGGNLAQVLPSEKMLLNHPVTKMDFYKRMNENSLLQYDLISTDKKGKGPVVVCVDISGSMEGEPEIWSKSFAVALLDVAQIQKRNYCYISFESRVCDVMIQEKGYLDPHAIVEICEHSTRGGTNFEHPLDKALDVLKDSRFKKGDIVFVTDGECSVSSDFMRKFNAIKEEKEFAVRGVLINIGNGSACKSSLDMFCDEVIVLSNMLDLSKESAVAEQIFRDI